MYTPEFPYKGNQLILMSDRVHIQSKSDYVILLGKQGVLLSTPKDVHINSESGIFLDSPSIELGHDAIVQGEKIILGETFIDHLTLFLKQIKYAGEKLEKVGATNVADMASKLVDAGTSIKTAAFRLENIIQISAETGNSRILSKTTYTR